MRNAMLPIVTVVGLSVGGLMSGAVLTETVFALPGVGTQLVSAILARDYRGRAGIYSSHCPHLRVR